MFWLTLPVYLHLADNMLSGSSSTVQQIRNRLSSDITWQEAIRTDAALLTAQYAHVWHISVLRCSLLGIWNLVRCLIFTRSNSLSHSKKMTMMIIEYVDQSGLEDIQWSMEVGLTIGMSSTVQLVQISPSEVQCRAEQRSAMQCRATQCNAVAHYGWVSGLLKQHGGTVRSGCALVW